jgi:integrase
MTESIASLPASVSEKPWIDIVRAQRPERLPVVLTIEEVGEVIGEVAAPAKLVVQLRSGWGLRLLEALRLRVKDVDLSRGLCTICSCNSAVTALVHEEDLMCGWGEVSLPDAIARKIPSAARDGRWQWVFPATRRCTVRTWLNARAIR